MVLDCASRMWLASCVAEHCRMKRAKFRGRCPKNCGTYNRYEPASTSWLAMRSCSDVMLRPGSRSAFDYERVIEAMVGGLQGVGRRKVGRQGPPCPINIT